MKTFLKISLITIALGITGLFSSGCKDNLPNQNQLIPSSNVSYSRYIQPIFNLKCTNSGCHDDETRAGELSLTNYANVTANPAIVFPGEPENSILVWAIEGKGGQKIMPPITAPVAPLTKNEIQGIITWIKEGAKAN